MFPFSNFKRRKYEQYIRISLTEIAQERCFHEDSDEYGNIDCGILYLGIQNWVDFWLKSATYFISCISFPNEPLISWTFLDHHCHHFWVGLLLLCCCTHPKVMTKWPRNVPTDGRFIRKRNTTYKIHTLGNVFLTWQ